MQLHFVTSPRGGATSCWDGCDLCCTGVQEIEKNKCYECVTDVANTGPLFMSTRVAPQGHFLVSTDWTTQRKARHGAVCV